MNDLISCVPGVEVSQDIGNFLPEESLQLVHSTEGLYALGLECERLGPRDFQGPGTYQEVDAHVWKGVSGQDRADGPWGKPQSDQTCVA